MTVPSETGISGPYAGNGVTTEFNYTFRIVDESHLMVVVRDEFGDVRVLDPVSDYMVTDVGEPAGGKVVTVEPLPAGHSMVILRNVPFVQETDLENQGAYYAETVERAFDLAVMRDQQLQEQLDRALKVPIGSDVPSDVFVDDLLKVADVLSDITVVIDFSEIYLGPKSADPVTRNNGGELRPGDLYFNTDRNLLRVYTSEGWSDAPPASLNMRPQRFVGDGVTTSYTLLDGPGMAANLLVWVGGVRQVPNVDYTVDGTTLTFSEAPGGAVPIETLLIATTSKLYAPADGTVAPSSFGEGSIVTIDSAAVVSSTMIHFKADAIMVAGWAAPGDGGKALYRRVLAQPAHAGKLQSADGAWWEIAEAVISPLMVGVKQGLTADQKSVFSDWLGVLAATGAKGYVPAGDYRLDSGITIPAGVTSIELDPAAVLDFSNSANNATYITIAGSEGPAVSLSADIARGDRVMSLTNQQKTDLGGVAAGTWLKVGSDEIFDAADTGSKLGELRQIDRIDGNTIYVNGAFDDGYTMAASAYAWKLSMVEHFHWRGGVIKGKQAASDNCVGFLIRFGLGCIIEHVELMHMDMAAIRLEDCVFCEINCNYIHDLKPNTTGYGISFMDATRDCIAMGNRFKRCRHSLSTNNNLARGGIVRRIKFANNEIWDSEYAGGGSGAGGDAIDTHSAAEEIEIIGNTVHSSSSGGINVECPSALISGNVIVSSLSEGIRVHNESDRPGNYVITGNRIMRSGGDGIYLYSGIRGTTAGIESAVITGNVIHGAASEGIRVATSTTGGNVVSPVISGNAVFNASGGAGIYLQAVYHGVVTGNTVRSTNGAPAIYLFNCQYMAVTGNAILGTSGYNIITVGGTSVGCSVAGNAMQTGSNGISLADTATYNQVTGNVVRGVTGSAVRLGSGTGNAAGNNITA